MSSGILRYSTNAIQKASMFNETCQRGVERVFLLFYIVDSRVTCCFLCTNGWKENFNLHSHNMMSRCSMHFPRVLLEEMTEILNPIHTDPSAIVENGMGSCGLLSQRADVVHNSCYLCFFRTDIFHVRLWMSPEPDFPVLRAKLRTLSAL